MATARFTKPIGICTEHNSIFVVDTGICALKLVTSGIPLKGLLSNLSTLLRTFGVHTSNEERKNCDLETGFSRLKPVKEFLQRCIDDARNLGAFTGQPCGPRGTMSSQTMTDIDRLIYGLENLQSILGDVNEGYTNKVDLLNLLTLLVENLFTEMRSQLLNTEFSLMRWKKVL